MCCLLFKGQGNVQLSIVLLSSLWSCAGFACCDLALGNLFVNCTHFSHIQRQVQYLKGSFMLSYLGYLPEVIETEVGVSV